VLSDLDGDGDLDVVVASRTSPAGGFVTLFGNGTGSLSGPSYYPCGDLPHMVALGDVNGDGRLDVAVPNLVGNTVTVYLATGPGTFGSSTTWSTERAPWFVALGDVNGDGRADMAASSYDDNS